MAPEVGITPAGMLPLFDPAAEDPPADAVELYLEAPLTVGLMFHLAAESEGDELRHFLVPIDEAREAGVDAALEALTGNTEVKVGDHYAGPHRSTIGLREPAQLSVTRVRHLAVAGYDDTARLHDHVYLGRRGVSKADGRHYPLDLDTFHTTHTIMDVQYRSALERSLMSTAGVEWSEPVDGERAELVAPPLHQCLPDYPRVLCHWHSPLVQRWIVGDRQPRRDNPFVLENRHPGENRPPWEDEDFDGWERAV